ncbi:MAG: hypothetical protein ACE5JX_18350 [Acidobacteriota bacterium]
MTRRSYCCTRPSALCFWCAMALVFYGLGTLLIWLWPPLMEYQSSLLLAALGLACLVNAVKNRTFHCLITGPLFLILAGALIFDVWDAFDFSSSLFWGVLLLGTGIAFLLEQRYAR